MFRKKRFSFVLCVFTLIKPSICFRLHTLQEHILRWIKPPPTSFMLGTLADLSRSKAELLAENALLRHQLIILHRRVQRPVYRKTVDFSWCSWPAWSGLGNSRSFLSSRRRGTHWHRELFRLFTKAQIPGALEQAKALARGDQFNPGNGSPQSTLGSRAHPW